MNVQQAGQLAQRRFDLYPPLNEEQVRAFEAKHEVKLPEEYREFLITAGNGGAARSVLPRDLFRLGEESEYKGLLSLLNHPFPHTQTYQLEHYAVSEIQGTIPLLHEGCGYHYNLVVSGQERGNVWLVDFCSNDMVTPILGEVDNERVGFFEWLGWWDAFLSRVH